MQQLISYGPVALYVVAIFYFGGAGGVAVPMQALSLSDKVVHALGFGGLALLFVFTVVREAPELRRRFQLTAAVAFAAFVGAALEFYQAALPQRSADVLDWAADVVGAIVAAAIIAPWLGANRPVSVADGGDDVPAEGDEVPGEPS